MRILITAVGKRTEHWMSLFTALTDQPAIEVTAFAADVSRITAQAFTDMAKRQERFRYQLVPHLLGEDHSGHMASVMFRPGSAKRVRAERPDVVHIIGEAAYVSTQQAIRMCNRYWPGVPITLYAAQNVVMRFPFPFPVLERRSYRAIGHAFPITPSALHVLRAKGYRGPATIVPLGVDTDRFRPSTEPKAHPFTVGFVGRLEPHKGIADLLRATELLDCNLLLVGDGSLRDMVEKAEANRPGQVQLKRWVDHTQLPWLLSRMHAVALPSMEIVQRNVVPWIGIPLREQFGRVLVEAMACGVPVVGSDTGDIPHVIGPSGLVFPTGDVGALADCLRQIRDDPALAHRLTVSGRSRACEEFSWRGIADTLIGVWQHLTATDPGLPSSSSPHARTTPSAMDASVEGGSE
ncbi:glycosyltransferase [Streptantibioticus ferralitis]|uniref:Glycosyltransferase n=1 Tax=Streptantibioticus ferralitis TaxID=236510 RepID=A0ABT5Z183_9ACTN|nr:glycosyltransferase [Streptantibioticus ferralitis]MDF2257454.1 glycosyltransferase [Streptantibioticus ferralitis]